MSGHDLPLVNACLNGLSGILLVFGLVFIKQGRREAHQRCMLAALVSSVVFLASYLIHKIFVMKGINTPFAGPVSLKPVYLAMLASHVVLAMVIVPLALMTLIRGMKGDFERHKRIARWTWPLWMYVSVTGVLIYLVLYRIWPAHGG